MRSPRRRYPRVSWLDALVYRFQHRWETNPQYRAAVAGVVGLVLVVLMCGCMGVVSLTANSALAGIGLAGAASGGGSANTGVQKLTGADTIPTNTVPSYTPPAIPNVAIPDSQTPKPGPTPTSTPVPATPTDTPTSGGGGVPTTCNGPSFVFSPCPLIHGQAGSLTVTAPQFAGQTINALISFGSCSGTVSCTIDITPAQGYAFNGSGVLVINFTVPAQVQIGAQPVSGMVNCAGGTIGLSAEPVQ